MLESILQPSGVKGCSVPLCSTVEWGEGEVGHLTANVTLIVQYNELSQQCKNSETVKFKGGFAETVSLVFPCALSRALSNAWGGESR